MDQSNHEPRKESTDVFRVVDDVSVISPVGKILLPPEEIRKDKLRKLGVIIMGGVIVVTATVLINKLTQTIRLNHALSDVSERGTPQSIEHALSLVTNRPALKARLLASAALEGDAKALDEAQDLINENASQLPRGKANDSDWQVAKIYMALTRGEPEKAKAYADEPGTFDVQASDFLRGRALALLGISDVKEAEEIAKKALELRPNSAALASLVSRVRLESGHIEEAEAVLNQVSGGNANLPSIKLMRARLEFARSPAPAEALAKEVAQNVRATPREKSWAQLLQAWSAFAQGNPTLAHDYLVQSMSASFAGELPRIITSAQLALILGDLGAAKQALSRITASQKQYSDRATLTQAWFDIETARQQGQPDNIDKRNTNDLIEIAKRSGALGELMRAKLGGTRRTESIERLRKLSQDPHLGVAAAQELALQLPQEESASLLLVQAQDMNLHPSVSELAVDAFLKVGDAAAALDLAQRSRAEYKDEPLSAITLARALIKAGNAAQALKLLKDLTKDNPQNANVAAALGHAAYAAQNRLLAHESFQSALRLDANHESALLGMLTLVLDSRDAASAQTFIEQLKTHELKSEEFDRLYARYLIWQKPGRETRSVVAAAARRHGDSPGLQILLAQSYLQLGQYSNAASAFHQARAKGGPDALMRASAAFALGLGGVAKASENTLKQIESPEPLSAEAKAMIDLARAAIGIGKDKPYNAKAMAQRAQKALPNSSYVAMVMAEGLGGKSKQTADAWRRALIQDPPLPMAAGRLALILGPTSEGCSLAKQYFEIVESDRARKDVREVLKTCVP